MPESAKRPLGQNASERKRAGYAKSADTRARILAAALAEASEAGFHKTSVARIAARAGVAVGNLNYHFGSRRELLREIMASLVSELLHRLHAAKLDDAENYFEMERRGLLVYLQYLRENPAYVRLADEVKLHDPKLYQDAVNAWVAAFVSRINSAVTAGEIRPMEHHEIAALGHFLLGSRHFIEQMMDPGDGHPYPGDEVVVDTYIGLIRHGLEHRRPNLKPSTTNKQKAATRSKPQ